MENKSITIRVFPIIIIIIIIVIFNYKMQQVKKEDIAITNDDVIFEVDDIIVNSVTVFLFLLCLEKVESGADDDGRYVVSLVVRKRYVEYVAFFFYIVDTRI